VTRWRAPLLALALLAGCGGNEAPPTDAGAPDAPQQASAFGAFPRANLVIISLDTLRADCTSMGGGPADISPGLQAFAQEAVLFEQARTQAPHTAPSHMSLFTSTLPSVHGVQNVAFKQEVGPGESKAVIVPAREDVPTLAEVLKAAGYRTVGLTDGGNLNPPHGFSRGFDTYTYDLAGAEAKVAAGVEQIERLTAQDAGPWFLFWHTYQIHSPYCPPESYLETWAPRDYTGVVRERLDSLKGMSFKERFSTMKTVFWKDRDSFGEPEARFLHGAYQGGVRYTDDQLGGLFAALREHGAFDDAVIVVLGDHGEEFHEHGHWQHEQVFEECLRVPLMLRLPGGRQGGTRIRTPVGLIDVMPTVLDLLGIETDKLQLSGRVRRGGRSLAANLLSGQEPPRLPIISELMYDRGEGGDFERLVAIYANDHKLIYDKVRGRKVNGEIIHARHLYDLSKDPGEQQDLASAGGPVLKAFEGLLEGYEALVQLEKASEQEREEVPLTPEAEEQLRELGYTK
jgi:arylsulfatase A-like enzyme